MPDAAVSIFERVRVRLDVLVATPAVVCCTAIMPWTGAHVAPAPQPTRTKQSSGLSVRALVAISSRLAEPYELAAGASDVDAGREGVLVKLSDGTDLLVAAEAIARHSPVLRVMLTCRSQSGCHGLSDEGESFAKSAACAWQEVSLNEISLLSHHPTAVRGVLRWMEAPVGEAKRLAAEAVLVPELIVEVARLTHFLDVQPLLHAALRIIGDALDVDNAPSCLLLAIELDDHKLAQQARGFIVAELAAVEQHAEYWEDMPLSTREALRALRQATLSNPLMGTGVARACATCDPRELLGMVRESLAEQRERLETARAREAAFVREVRETRSPHAQRACRRRRTDAPLEGTEGTDDASMAARPGVEEALRLQAARIRSLEKYLQQQEHIFAKLVDEASADTPEAASVPLYGHESPHMNPQRGMPPSEKPTGNGPRGETAEEYRLEQMMHRATNEFSAARAGRHEEWVDAVATSINGRFHPRYEWQHVPDGVFSLCPGLQIDLPLDGRPRRARIPPKWRLAVWISQDHGFWRMDVTRDTVVAALRANAAMHLRTHIENVGLRYAGSAGFLQDTETCEDIALFDRKVDLQVLLLDT